MSFGGSSGAAPTSGVATFSGKSNSAGPTVATFSNADGGRVSALEFSHSEIEAAIQRMRFGLFRATASKPVPQEAPSKTAATPEVDPPSEP